jgi:sec-independent protein translocase protein TatC
VFTQTLMAGPLIILYEISIWVAHFFGGDSPAKEPAKSAA